ncbi:hypothetical protein [Streptococcus pneumoniae]|nr:hypothetical protein [Streptococcus pneumoniae]
MKIKKQTRKLVAGCLQTRKLAAGCSKHCFEVVEKLTWFEEIFDADVV